MKDGPDFTGDTVRHDLFARALATISHGLCMYDDTRRLMFCNRAYAAMYDLPAHLTRPGTDLGEILEYREKIGNGPRNRDTYFDVVIETVVKKAAASQSFVLTDGRVIKISHNPLDGGGYVAVHEDITEATRASEQVHFMAGHDPLTGLPNRTLLREKLDHTMPAGSTGPPLALLFVDLDRFKAVNDTLGHAVGDVLLKLVTDRLRACLREGDFVARIGGDEFVILAMNAQDREQAAALAERVCTVIAQPFDIASHVINIGASVGISITPSNCRDVDVLVKNADTALYEAKSQGRGTYCFFDRAMNANQQARLRFEADLGRALAAGELEIYYQPEVDALTESITAFEALLRWRHPELGLLLPDAFLSLAEECGLIVPIGEWCLRKACMDASSWPPHIRVAVNLSAGQCRSASLARTVISALAASELPPSRLELEITEAALLNDSQATLLTLHHIKGLGVRIVMDDFGTGYSSLNYLRLFPFDKIKIAQAFIGEANAAGDYDAIVRAMVALGLSRGFTTTVEGVETAEQARRAAFHGCTEIQGYFYGRPVPLGEAERLYSDIALVKAAATTFGAAITVNYAARKHGKS